MILIDTFDSDAEAAFLIEALKKRGIPYERKDEGSCGIYINEADEAKLNELVRELD